MAPLTVASREQTVQVGVHKEACDDRDLTFDDYKGLGLGVLHIALVCLIDVHGIVKVVVTVDGLLVAGLVGNRVSKFVGTQ